MGHFPCHIYCITINISSVNNSSIIIIIIFISFVVIIISFKFPPLSLSLSYFIKDNYILLGHMQKQTIVL